MYKILRKNRANCTSGGGFTLAELLIVVAVIAVLVAVAIPTFAGQLEKSRQAVDVSNLRDAYAVAKLAVLNQSDTGAALKSAYDGAVAGTSTAAVNKYYNPTTEGLVDAESDATKIGKSTASKVVTAGLPSEVTYSGQAVGKSIKVTFEWDATNGQYKLKTVAFNATGGGGEEPAAFSAPSSLSFTYEEFNATNGTTGLDVKTKAGSDLKGGTTPYKFTAVSVTSGFTDASSLAIDESTGVLTWSGTPTADGVLSVTVTDSATAVASKTITVNVKVTNG